MGIYGCDIVSLYKEKLPQDILCYYRDGNSNGYRIVSEYWIQAELDRGNAELEEVLMDIMRVRRQGSRPISSGEYI